MGSRHTVKEEFYMDQGFRIGIGNLCRPLFPSQGHNPFRAKPPSRNIDALGDMPILTKGAPEIAPRETQGEDQRTGAVMVKGLFFNGIHGRGGDKAVIGDKPFPLPVPPNPAISEISRPNLTAPGTEGTL
jgi:hypothetical protein